MAKNGQFWRVFENWILKNLPWTQKIPSKYQCGWSFHRCSKIGFRILISIGILEDFNQQFASHQNKNPNHQKEQKWKQWSDQKPKSLRGNHGLNGWGIGLSGPLELILPKNVGWRFVHYFECELQKKRDF